MDIDYNRDIQVGTERIRARLLGVLPEGAAVQSQRAPSPYETSYVFIAGGKQLIVPDGIIVACARVPANVLHHLGDDVLEQFKDMPSNMQMVLLTTGPKLEPAQQV